MFELHSRCSGLIGSFETLESAKERHFKEVTDPVYGEPEKVVWKFNKKQQAWYTEGGYRIEFRSPVQTEQFVRR